MKKILLIEDNTEIRENVAEVLELSNYKVFTAADGKAGVATALQEIPDLIICDIMMPVLDGYGVLHALQHNDAVKHIPFIFLTAKTERMDQRRGMEMGADDYITKPFSGTELLGAVESRLKKSEQLRQSFGAGIDAVDKMLDASGNKIGTGTLKENRDINSYKKKQRIYNEGNRPYRLYYIVKGKVKVFKTNNEGKELIINLCNEGDFFGYVALLENSLYKESAEALEDCELALIPKDEFEKLMNSSLEISSQFIKLLAQSVADKEELLLSIAYNSLRKKVADAILSIEKKYNTAGEENFSFSLSRENLAGIAGTATESLIRTLSDFRDEKLVEVKGGQITILNKKKLENMVN